MIIEMYIKKNDLEMISRLDSLKTDPSADVRIQLSPSLRTNNTDKAKLIVKQLLASNPKQPVDAIFLYHLRNRNSGFG